MTELPEPKEVPKDDKDDQNKKPPDYSFLRPKKLCELDNIMPTQVWDSVICLGDRVMISGATKSYKSFFAKQFTLCITYGIPFLERLVSTPIQMLDIDMELREYFCRLRVEKIAASIGIQNTDKYIAICLRGQARKLSPAAISYMGEQMSIQSIKGAFLDPVYKLERPGVAENSVAEVTALLDPFDQITFKYNLLFLWIHHHSKGAQADKEAHERGSGSGAWSRYADVIIDLLAHQEPFCFIVQITQRNFPAIEKFVVQFDLNQLIFVCRADLSPEEPKIKETKIQGRPAKLQIQIETSLAIVRALDDVGGVSHEQWQGFSMIPTSSFRKIKKILLANKQVYLSITDDTFHLTPEYKKQCNIYP